MAEWEVRDGLRDDCDCGDHHCQLCDGIVDQLGGDAAEFAASVLKSGGLDARLRRCIGGLKPGASCEYKFLVVLRFEVHTARSARINVKSKSRLYPSG
jgi:hypothetical protein